MNKKFLSAILFGAMLATSAGTFVSCKDYDDDIKGLQTQIDTNKTAIAELQKLVGAGNWVTSVAASGENLVVTMSNGTTATIAGIKGADGVDGKNAAEWTIGEDGYWYKDGEKTANLAVAQNGKDGQNGLTAPSPKIENGVWVVYSWDAEKGEFVEEVTEISAAGTSSYVVLKNGVYTLNIADENGEMIEVSLPATCESFVVNAISLKEFAAQFSYGEWKTPTNKANKELFDKLAAEFPELKEYKNKQLVTQGNKLPFIVSPANMEFTKDHTFALVDSKGNDSGATLSNPTAGMPEELPLVTRATQGSSVWSVEYLPALDKKGADYLSSKANVLYSLVVSGANGVASATPFAYSYTVTEAKSALDLSVNNGDITKYYNEEGIDIFSSVTGDAACITLPADVLKGMFILEATDPAQVEELGVSIEGSVVTIADMPKGKNINVANGVELKLTAISVNGSVDEFTFKLGVNNVIAATGALADLEETLTGALDKKGEYAGVNQELWWSLDELELSAMQMKSFVGASKELRIYTTDIVNNAETTRTLSTSLATDLYDANKKKTTDYTKVEYIKATFDVSHENTLPGDYTVELMATDANGAVILKAESELTLVNPEVAELASIAEALLNEEGEAIVTSLTAYNLDNLFNKVGGTTITNYVDTENEYDATENKDWWASSAHVSINPAAYTTWNADGTVDTEVDKVRTFKATVNMFGNTANTEEIEFKVKWISAIYAEDATDVITMTPAKLKIKFDDTTPSTKANKIDFKAITAAIYAQGSSKGVTYKLFGKAEGEPSSNTVTYFDYTSGSKLTLNGVNYMTTGEKYVEVRLEDMLALNFTEAQLLEAQNDATKRFKLTETHFTTLYNAVMAGKDKNGKDLMEWASNNQYDAYRPVATASNITNATLKKQYEMFVYYAGLIKFNSFDKTTQTAAGDAESRASEIKSVNFKLVNADDAKFLSTAVDATADNVNGFALTAKASKDIDKTALVEGKKVIPMEMIITDVWGKVMTYEFNVEISL